jgi:hypothetical protein
MRYIDSMESIMERYEMNQTGTMVRKRLKVPEIAVLAFFWAVCILVFVVFS